MVEKLDLKFDLEWLVKDQNRWDLSDEYLTENGHKLTRDLYENSAPELVYGITFVESGKARQWLNKAIKLEALNAELVKALKAVEASVIRNGDNSISYAIDGKIARQISVALAKAEGKKC